MASFGRRKSVEPTETYGEIVKNDIAEFGDPFTADNPPADNPPAANPPVIPAERTVTMSTFDPSNLVIEDADALPSRKRKVSDNPFTAVMADSLATGKAKRTPPLPNDDAVKDVTGLLRRAAADAGHGLELRPVDNGDGTVTLHFRANSAKRSRAYTVDQVRAWAVAEGYSDAELSPRVAKHVSAAYRLAHGLKVAGQK